LKENQGREGVSPATFPGLGCGGKVCSAGFSLFPWYGFRARGGDGMPASHNRLKPALRTDRLKPALRTDRLKPALRTNRLKPALRTDRLKPALRTDRLKPALRTDRLKPALRTNRLKPALRTNRLKPALRTCPQAGRPPHLLTAFPRSRAVSIGRGRGGRIRGRRHLG